MASVLPSTTRIFPVNNPSQHSRQNTLGRNPAMKKTVISTIVPTVMLCSAQLHAAALDRTGQSILPFLQPGNYFEAGIAILDPKL